VYEKDRAAGEAESAELRLLPNTEVTCDNAVGFASTLGARVPDLVNRNVYQELLV
jgi:hypothetical protein